MAFDTCIDQHTAGACALTINDVVFRQLISAARAENGVVAVAREAVLHQAMALAVWWRGE